MQHNSSVQVSYGVFNTLHLSIYNVSGQEVEIKLDSECFAVLTGGLFGTWLIIRTLIEACSLWSIAFICCNTEVIPWCWMTWASDSDPRETLKWHWQAHVVSHICSAALDINLPRGRQLSTSDLLTFYEWHTQPTDCSHFVLQVTVLYSISDKLFFFLFFSSPIVR